MNGPDPGRVAINTKTSNMKVIASIASVILALAAPARAADPVDPAVAGELEKMAVGYWAPDQDAMLKLYTEEKGMKQEDAAALVGESEKLTIHVEKGIVHVYTTQGILSMPYKILGADKASGTLTLQADGGPDAPEAEAMKVAIKEDRITAMGGQMPFMLKKIDEAEFKKRKNAVPARRVGP